MRRFYSNIPFLVTLSLCLFVTACENRPLNEANGGSEVRSKRLGDIELAKVDGTYIYQSDVERLAIERGAINEKEPLSQIDPMFETLLEELIDQRLLSLAAMKRSLDQTSVNKQRLAAARERILGNLLVEEHLKETVNETTIRRMYDEQASLADRGEEVRARHILVAEEAEAKAVLKQLVDGESFADLAQSLSLDDGSKTRGGDLGYFSRDMLSPDFTSIVFETKEGERTDIFQTNFGWHIAEIIDRRSASKQSFETLRPNIIQFMTYDAIQSLVEDLRRDSEIETLYAEEVAPENSDISSDIDQKPIANKDDDTP